MNDIDKLLEMNKWLKQKQEKAVSDELVFRMPTPKKSRATSPESEIRDMIQKLLDRPFPYVCGRTRGMSVDEMYRMYNSAIHFKANPKALMMKLLKERQLKQK